MVATPALPTTTTGMIYMLIYGIVYKIIIVPSRPLRKRNK